MATFRPSLLANVPDGWLVKESITLLSPDGRANVIASSEPIDPSINSEQYARIQGDLLQEEFPGYALVQFGELEVFGGRPGYYRSFQWLPPDQLPVTQFQLYFAEGGRGYTATGTTPVDTAAAYQDVLLTTLERLSIMSVTADN